MASAGVYVYGFVRADEAPDLGCIGLEHGGTPARVYSVPAGPVAAIVSDYEAQRRVMALRRNLDPHDRVIRETLRHTTILPATFGHVARSAHQVANLLHRHGTALVRELDRLGARVEMGVRITWDVENIVQYVVDGHPVLAEFRDRIFSRGKEADPDDKIELGRMFEDSLETERAQVVERVVGSLLPHATDVHVGRTNGDTTAADVAFLVPRQATHAFRERVLEVAAAWPSEYMFQCSGPWAPFNFVRLNLGRADREPGGAACTS